MDFEPGPELDAEIARRVFGYEILPYRNADNSATFFADGALYRLTPGYSTDIAAAWQIVQKMHDDGWTVHLQCYTNPHDVRGWSCTFVRPGAMGAVAVSYFSQAPLAICRAALDALTSK